MSEFAVDLNLVEDADVPDQAGAMDSGFLGASKFITDGAGKFLFSAALDVRRLYTVLMVEIQKHVDNGAALQAVSEEMRTLAYDTVVQMLVDASSKEFDARELLSRLDSTVVPAIKVMLDEERKREESAQEQFERDTDAARVGPIPVGFKWQHDMPEEIGRHKSLTLVGDREHCETYLRKAVKAAVDADKKVLHLSYHDYRKEPLTKVIDENNKLYVHVDLSVWSRTAKNKKRFAEFLNSIPTLANSTLPDLIVVDDMSLAAPPAFIGALPGLTAAHSHKAIWAIAHDHLKAAVIGAMPMEEPVTELKEEFESFKLFSILKIVHPDGSIS